MDNLTSLWNSPTATAENDYLLIFVSFVCCIISSFCLKIVYENRSSSLSGKYHVGIVIPILAQVTFLIILIVKSSLALSLGLIGALSIVRFRTPIKEPEELIYLFLAISLGIGFGAGQIIITSLVFFIILLIIWFFLSKEKVSKVLDYNLIIEWSDKKKDNSELEQIFNKLKEIFTDINIIRTEINDENKSILVAQITLKDLSQIQNITNDLKKNHENIKLTFYESRVLF